MSQKVTKEIKNIISINNARSIQIHCTVSGHGATNHGGESDVYSRKNARFADGESSGILCDKHDNVKYIKANIYVGNDGKHYAKYKISANAMRAYLFGEGSNSCPAIDADAEVFLRASINNLLRGYMDATQGYKRRSAVGVTDAELSNGAKASLETCTTSGVRDSNSYFVVETLGETEWKFIVTVDLSELAFICLSEVHDRLAMSHNLEGKFVAQINKNFDTNLAPKSYLKKDGSCKVPETGLLLDDNALTDCVNYLISRIRGISRVCATSEVHFDHFDKVTFVHSDGSREDVNLNNGEQVKLADCSLEYEAVDDSEGVEQAFLAGHTDTMKKRAEDAAKEKKEKAKKLAAKKAADAAK